MYTTERRVEMSKRITLSVPDELHTEMENWKDQLNFSRIFQDAISKRIQKEQAYKNRFEQGEETMQETIERLKTEKAQHNEELLERAEMVGFEWARNAAYEDLFQFRDVLNVMEETEAQGIDPASVMEPCESAMGSINAAKVHSGLDLKAIENGEDSEIDWEFPKAWAKGYCRFWNAVADKL
jgi:post-segregation antitoxin (ccd killing protein)